MIDHLMSLTDAAAGLEAGRFSSSELVETALTEIEKQKALNCFITVMGEQGRAEAKASDERRARGETLGPLDGIPIAVKDNIDVAGVPATAGMAVRRDRVPAEDAFCVGKLRQAGAILLGKLNLHEAALGATNDNAHFGRCYNPHGSDRTPGGSSGGSAAAVAAGLVHGALGTDTMGSIRIPASYCGVVGLKPTYGRVSTRGVCAISWQLDHVGPLARTVKDAGLLLDAISGFDLDCADSRPMETSQPNAFRLGLLDNYGQTEMQPAAREAFERALGILRDLGYRIGNVAIDDYSPAQARRHGLLISEVDAALVHEKELARTPELFSEATRAMLEFGRRAPAVKLAQAQRTVASARTKARRLLAGLDAIVSPTTPQTAFRFGEAVPENQGDLTALANFAGCPALSIPIGADAEGMPIGLQLMGPQWSEARLLEIGSDLEAAIRRR